MCTYFYVDMYICVNVDLLQHTYLTQHYETHHTKATKTTAIT